MNKNLKKLVGMAIAVVLSTQGVMFSVTANEEPTDSIDYIVNDSFNKLETNVGSQYFDDCGWSIGETSDDTVYKVNTAFGSKAAQADMAYFSFSEGAAENGQQPNVRKDLATPIDVTKGTVIIETKVAVDSGIAAYNVGLELNRPAKVENMAENAQANNKYRLFSMSGYTEGGQTKTSVYVRNSSSTTNYLDGYTKPEGSSFSRPVLNYGEAVAVKAVIDYAKNHVDYYLTYPDGNTYSRTDGTLSSHDLMSSKEISSLAFTTTGKGNANKQVNFWVDYINIYQILETSASISTDGRVDSDIKVTFDNAKNFSNIDFSKYVSLKNSAGDEIEAQKSYIDGAVIINPDESLLGNTEYTVTVDKDALSNLACKYTGSDFTFTTLGENEYLNDTLTKTDACGWVGNSYANFPSSHWAGGNSACVQYKQADGETAISPYSVQKNLENPISLTDGKVMIEVDMMSDTTNNLSVDFNINKDENTVNNDALFRVSGSGASSSVSVRGNNGGLSKAYNPNMTVGATDDGRPTFAFAEKINVKMILDYDENNVKYYVAFTNGDVIRVYSRDGWGDMNNMTLSGGIPTEIKNLSFTASGVSSKFWIDKVKVTKADEITASISVCDPESVTVAFAGTAGDYSKYIDIYDANGGIIESEKEYNADTNEVVITPDTALTSGKIYYAKFANVLFINETGKYYSANTAMSFIPNESGYRITNVDSNRGTGAYFSAEIKNNNSDKKTVMAVIVEKDSKGVLQKVKVDAIELANGDSEGFYANFINVSSENVIEAYVWEVSSMKPIIEKITVVGR